MNEVVSVFPSRILQLRTTRSWDLLGFPETVHRKPSAESGVIIGVIDSGIWPESASFTDKGLGSIPKKWKECLIHSKIIGARAYTEDATARAYIGHGTHTASTAAGGKVKGASFYGLAQGTARGGIPSTRVAAYKVCDQSGCRESDILAASDDEISDRVDDSIAIGAFHAVEKGILTIQSAGNNGNSVGSVVSVAPWLFSVAASSTDRRIIDKVVPGDGRTLTGKKYPSAYGKDATSLCTEEEAEFCNDGCLDEILVKGKVVLCEMLDGVTEARRAGALGSITVTRIKNVSFIVPLPVLSLTTYDYEAVRSYKYAAKLPTASILKSEVIRDFAAPVVASFSSRVCVWFPEGEHLLHTDLSKSRSEKGREEEGRVKQRESLREQGEEKLGPDISAPGVEILAAYSPEASVTASPIDKRSVTYSILSGTSMSCPHVAGAAAYVNSVHPGWSPAAIQSALMTTGKSYPLVLLLSGYWKGDQKNSKREGEREGMSFLSFIWFIWNENNRKVFPLFS
ncbi:hypothetical protein Nepgr_009276 [Nepenthes gracilis]|uniref:Peptidase S8/S53 domain-containing protein n=1 Tax=Nepenthes gracilis TaxID=150966 RepID=A0AAD3SAK9_NEPGR|nr:hypothetical protein Nepgr_009276 [Nepenthes gracilis]